MNKKKTNQRIKEIETKLNCHLVSKSSNLLHFKANTDDCPSNAELLKLLPTNTTVKRHHNLLFERLNPKPYEVALIFVGMENIPDYLSRTFGGHSPKPHLWRLYNMSMYNTDARGYKEDILPTAEDIKDHIDTIYHVLNPNKYRDFHKTRVELFNYCESTGLWECGCSRFNTTILVKAPSYLGAGCKIYINTNKKASLGFSRIYDYYGKDLCKKEADGDYAKLFALHPDAIYDWFYSQERILEEVADVFSEIEISYHLRPYLYYCKGEYNKIRQIFLIETMRFIKMMSKEQISSLPQKMRNSMFALCNKHLVSSNDISSLDSCLKDAL